MKNGDLGINIDRKFRVPARFNNNHENIKNEFLKHPDITGATASSGIYFGYSTITTRLISGDFKEIIMAHLYFDHDFISEFKIQMAAGRPFDEGQSSDINRVYLINEAAAKAFGWSSPEEAIGQMLQSGGREEEHTRTVIGVVKDFHYEGFQDKIEPLVMINKPDAFRELYLSVQADNFDETKTFIEDTWTKLNLGQQYSFSFVEDYYYSLYNIEERERKIFTLFSLLAVFLSCFGLVGIASFAAERRTKEIGVRKVLGASVPKIARLLLDEFVKLVLFASFFAAPVAWYIMNNWLRNFAYHINIGLDVFVISGSVTLMIALITLSFQTINAAYSNPVNSLRND
ncbi:ABC transporter permease [candidate division KSB1 bacterium]